MNKEIKVGDIVEFDINNHADTRCRYGMNKVMIKYPIVKVISISDADKCTCEPFPGHDFTYCAADLKHTNKKLVKVLTVSATINGKKEKINILKDDIATCWHCIKKSTLKRVLKSINDKKYFYQPCENFYITYHPDSPKVISFGCKNVSTITFKRFCKKYL